MTKLPYMPHYFLAQPLDDPYSHSGRKPQFVHLHVLWVGRAKGLHVFSVAGVTPWGGYTHVQSVCPTHVKDQGDAIYLTPACTTLLLARHSLLPVTNCSANFNSSKQLLQGMFCALAP